MKLWEALKYSYETGEKITNDCWAIMDNCPLIWIYYDELWQYWWNNTENGSSNTHTVALMELPHDGWRLYETTKS